MACRHVTTLDLRVARGEKRAPDWAAPHLVVIRELGKQHEAAYLDYLVHRQKMAVVNLADIKDEKKLIEETLRLMEQGSEVIAQGAMANGKWFGRPDVLRRVAKHSPKWEWSYEVADTKLTPDTKAATLLQLSLYSELLEQVQGCGPESMWVIPPGQNFDRRTHIAWRIMRRTSDTLSPGWKGLPRTGTQMGLTQNPFPTVTCAVGFASVTHRGEETIICR